MTRIALMAVGLLAAVVSGYALDPDLYHESARRLGQAVSRVWANLEANPIPMGLALGTFLLTVIYHTARGKSLGESVEVAATRVTVVPVPAADDETPVVRRARARAVRAQLLTAPHELTWFVGNVRTPLHAGIVRAGEHLPLPRLDAEVLPTTGSPSVSHSIKTDSTVIAGLTAISGRR